MPTLSELDRYVVPLLQGDESRPQILGTATFCEVDGNDFLVTAAHVVDGTDTLIFGRGIIQDGARAQVTTTAMPASGNRDDDLLKLSPEQARALRDQGRHAISVSDWDVDDIARADQSYVFSGFPASRIERDRARRVVDPLGVSAKCRAVSDKRVAKIGLHPRWHAVGVYRRRRMSNGNGLVIMGPDPFGMSGGPVWTKRGNSDRYAWVGVGIEYRRDDSVLVGTRLGALSALMGSVHPEIAVHLPRTRTYRFEVA